MARKNKTTASKVKETKLVEVSPVEEIVIAVEDSAEEKPAEVIPEEEITAPVEEISVSEKKKTAKKPTTRKTAEKTTKAVKTTKTVKAETSVEKKTTAKKPASVNVFFQSHGNESAELVEKAKELSGVKSPKSVNLYIKPEENMVYYVVDDISGGFAL